MTWDATRQRLAQEVFRRGVKEVAARLPAHAVTVYRIISGETQKPHLALRQSIERLIHERKELHGNS